MKRFLITILFLCGMAFGQARICPIAPTRAAVNLTASGDNTVIASDPTKKIFVWQWFLVNSHASADQNLTVKEGATSISGAYLVKAAGGSHTANCTGTPWAIVPAGSNFVLNLSATGSIQGTVYYTTELP